MEKFLNLVTIYHRLPPFFMIYCFSNGLRKLSLFSNCPFIHFHHFFKTTP